MKDKKRVLNLRSEDKEANRICQAKRKAAECEVRNENIG